jgi:hypothetical protein
VIDGPFAETKELVAGFWIWNVMKTHNVARKQPTIRMLRVVGVTVLSLIAFAAVHLVALPR